ncbi:Peptidoglycan-recognition protein SC2 [Bulinus truncatus]|nr:Peptidoglycan-recognition protein SC2 [Bulinus truncatus]
MFSLTIVILAVCASHAFGACPHVVTRAEWGARAPHSVTHFSNPAHYAFIHHSEAGECNDRTSCAALVRSYQNYHMDTNGWSDIGYSFLIGGDGSVFEGRGWDKVGAHTQGYNSVGYEEFKIRVIYGYFPRLTVGHYF